MAYDEALAARLRALLGPRGDIVEKLMFGGLTFMVAGHMCCGVTGRAFMFRVGPRHCAAALAEPGVGPCDFTGTPMKGMVLAAADGDDRVAGRLLAWSLDHVGSLPPR